MESGGVDPVSAHEMPLWAWLILAFSAGVLATAAVGTRVRRVIRVVHKMSLGAIGSSGEVEPSDITSPA